MNKLIVKNVAFSIILNLIVVISGFVIPSLLIVNYGSENNGILTTSRQLTAGLTIVASGISLSAITLLYGEKEVSNNKYVNMVLSSAKKMYTRISIWYLFIVLILILIFWLINFQNNNTLHLIGMMSIFGIAVFIDLYFFQKYYIIVRSRANEYITSISYIYYNLFVLIMTIIITQLSFSFTWIAVVYLVATILKGVYIKYKTDKTYKIDFGLQPDKKLLSSKKDVFAHEFASFILTNVDYIIISIFFGFNYVTLYLVYSLIYVAISKIITTLTGSLIYVMGITKSKGDDIYRNNFQLFEYFYYNFIGLLFTVSLVFTIPFLKIYTREFIEFSSISHQLILLFFVAEYLNKLRTPSSIAISSLGHFNETKKHAFIEVAINIIFSIIGALTIGFEGVLLGTILCFMYRDISFFMYTSKLNEIIGVKKRIKTWVFSLIPVAIVIFGSYFFKFDYITDYISLLLYLVLGSFLYLLVFILKAIILEKVEFKNFIFELYKFVKKL